MKAPSKIQINDVNCSQNFTHLGSVKSDMEAMLISKRAKLRLVPEGNRQVQRLFKSTGKRSFLCYLCKYKIVRYLVTFTIWVQNKRLIHVLSCLQVIYTQIPHKVIIMLGSVSQNYGVLYFWVFNLSACFGRNTSFPSVDTPI